MPILKSQRRPSCRVSAKAIVSVFLLTAGPGLAAPPDTLPPLKEFTATGGKVNVTLTLARASGAVAIGATQVDGLNTLTVCSTANPTDCADPYAGAVLKLQPGETLTALLNNTLAGSGGSMPAMCMDHTAAWDNAKGWSSADGKFNQHFHGLLVPPTAGKPGDPAKPFGDYVFTCTHGSGNDAARSYSMTLAAPQANSDPGHPLGIDWFHPHVHGIAKPQVSSGMAGMILVGDPACSQTSACSDVRAILLKDAQLVKVAGTGGASHWLNFADQEPGFCGNNTLLASNVGGCNWDTGVALSSGGVDLAPSEGRWSVTLNGAEYPTIVVADAQVWRIQNASANITYRLSLRRLNAAPGSVVADAPFEVISMDGAGLAGSAGNGQLAPTTREILLMPGSRADLRVIRPDDGEVGDLAYQLVNEAFQAGFAPDDADTWPHVALAQVIFAAQQVASVATPAAPGAATARQLRRQPTVAPLRLPVQANASALLRGTALTRSAGVTTPAAPEADLAPLQQLPPDQAQPAGMAAAPPPAIGARNDPFALSRWLGEDCDGYHAGDARSQFDAMLAAAGSSVAGHQPVANDGERRRRYWTALNFNPVTTHRRVYFGIGEAAGEERFVIGETFVRANGAHVTEFDVWGRPITASNPVVLTSFDAAKGLCVLKRLHDPANPAAGVEQWELVNVSREVHNFHIHQMKFTVARDGNGQAVMRTPSAADLVLLPAALLLTAGGGAPAELQHDTIIVPRGVSACHTSLISIGAVGTGEDAVYGFRLDRSSTNAACTGLDRHQITSPQGPGTGAGTPPDGSGMILVNMAFQGDWLKAQQDGDNIRQPARFVFHCHILEHEDKGMMHRIAVLDPTL